MTYVDRMPVWGETWRFEMSHGGEADQAVAAANYNNVVMVSKVGDDMLGEGVLLNFERMGVDASHVERMAGQSTGTRPFSLTSGDNFILIVKGANRRP